MKGVLTWLKRRWYVVVSAVVILAALPTGWLLSSGWNKEIRSGIEQQASDKLNRLKRAKVSYVIPSVVPGQDDIVIDHVPNEALTAWVKSQRDTRVAEASAVMERAIAFNRGPHGGLFDQWTPVEPEQQSARNRVMLGYLAAIAGDVDAGVPSAYEALFEKHGAGRPADPLAVAQALAEQKERDEERARAESPTGQLDPATAEQIATALTDRRIGEYRRAAQRFSFYADPSVLAAGELEGGVRAIIPPLPLKQRRNAEAPQWADGFAWLADYWAVEDVLRSVERANRGVAGERTDVAQSAVKRVLSIAVEELPLYEAPSEGEGMGFEPPPPPGPADAAGGLPVRPDLSITGRFGSNELYDLRRISVSMIVSSAALPAVLDAFSQTNMMTVLDVDMSEVNVWNDLRQGYYYGTEHVVRADVTIESLWLRAWTKEWMPTVVKQFLGVPEDEPAFDGGEG